MVLIRKKIKQNEIILVNENIHDKLLLKDYKLLNHLGIKYINPVDHDFPS